jgi:hypothetical protein
MSTENQLLLLESNAKKENAKLMDGHDDISIDEIVLKQKIA